VWKSTKIDNSLNPIWAASKIPMSSLCNGDVHRPIRIEIFDWDSNGKHQSMGQVSGVTLDLHVHAVVHPPALRQCCRRRGKKTRKSHFS
jgi:hypothetical protein